MVDGMSEPQAAEMEALHEASFATPSLVGLAPFAMRLPARARLKGREAALEAVVEAAISDEPRPYAVGGPRGIGKTALLSAVLHDSRVERRFGPRRYFARLDAGPYGPSAPLAKRRAGVVTAIARAIPDLDLGPSLASRVLRHLVKSPSALILDGIDAAMLSDRFVRELLSLPKAGYGLSVLLGHAEPPAAESGDGTRFLTLHALEAGAATEAFLSRAGTASRADSNLPALMKAAAGNPLILSLMAAEAEGERSLRTLARRWLDEKTGLLRGSEPDAEPETLVSIALALALHGPWITEAARALLALFARLPDGMSADDLPRLVPDYGAAAAPSLFRAGFLVEEGGRVLTPSVVRAHVLASYPAPVEDLDLVGDWYIDLAAAQGKRVGREGGSEALELLRGEIGNIERAIEVGLERPSADRAIQSTISYARFLRATGLGSEAIVEKAREAARRTGDALSEANAFQRLGDLAWDRGDMPAARLGFTEALSLYRRVKNVFGEAICLRKLGDVVAGEFPDEARDRYLAALPLFRGVGFTQEIATCLQGLGEVALRKLQFEEARRLFTEALPLHREAQDVVGEANCKKCLGDLALRGAAPAEARQLYEDALLVYRRLGDLAGEAGCVRGLGDVASSRSELAVARKMYARARPLYRRVGDALGEANCVYGLAGIALSRAELEEAGKLYEEALALYRGLGSSLGEAHCLYGLGNVAGKRGDASAAARQLDGALALYRQVPEPFSIGLVYRRLARLATDPSERRRHLGAARDAWLGIGRIDLAEGLLKEFAEA